MEVDRMGEEERGGRGGEFTVITAVARGAQTLQCGGALGRD